MGILANPFEYSGLLPTRSLFTALTVGNVIGFCLFGALTVQVYIYYISFPNDSKTMKVTIYVVYLVEAIYTAMLAYDLTSLMLYPRKDALTSLLVPVCGGLVALLTQAVYAHRIRIVTRMKLVPLCINVLMGLETVFTAVLISLHLSFYIVSLVWSVSSLVADFTIAVIMVRTLTKQEILSKRLQRRIARLVHVIVGCNILTVAVNIATLVTSLYSLDLTFPCGIILSKLYANGMMVLINGRRFQYGDHGPSPDDMTIHVGAFPSIGTGTANSQHGQSSTPSDWREK